MTDTRYTLERFTAPICDGGGQSIAVVDTTKGDDDFGRYVATFSQGWDTSAQEYADKLNAEHAAVQTGVKPAYGQMVANDSTGHTRRYQTRNGHTFNEHAAPCVNTCDACNGTGPYADEPWYSDGLY